MKVKTVHPNQAKFQLGRFGRLLTYRRHHIAGAIGLGILARARSLREAFSVKSSIGQERYRIYSFRGWIE